MGHESNDARKALRAHACDLHTAAHISGSVASIATPKQDDAPTQFLGSGAPHQLAIAAAVVRVVLLWGIGFVNATDPARNDLANPPSAQVASAVTVFVRTGDVSTRPAIRAFNDLGLRELLEIDCRAIAQRVESNSGSVGVACHRARQRLEDAYTSLGGDIT
jgi:hypothetical protein